MLYGAGMLSRRGRAVGGRGERKDGSVSFCKNTDGRKAQTCQKERIKQPPFNKGRRFFALSVKNRQKNEKMRLKNVNSRLGMLTKYSKKYIIIL